MNKHYLSKLTNDHDRRASQRYRCKAVIRLLYKHSARRPIASCRAVMVDISQAGALLATTLSDVPDSFYIVIGNFEYSIGCVVVRKDGGKMAVEFIKEQPRRLIEAFAMLSFPMAPLFSMSDLLKNRMTQVAAESTGVVPTQMRDKGACEPAFREPCAR